MAPSRGQDGQNTINTGKCPRQPRSGSIVHTHRSGSWETETVKRYDQKSAKSRHSSFKAYYLKDQLSAANTPIGRIKTDVRAPGSTAKISGRRGPRQKKNIQGSRHRNDQAPGSTAKMSGLLGSRGRPPSPRFGTDQIVLASVPLYKALKRPGKTKYYMHSETFGLLYFMLWIPF